MKKAFFIIMLLLSSIARSQETIIPKKLEEMSLEELLKVDVVTANKSSKQALEAPATILVVTAEQIKQRGYRSLKDVLMDLPDIKYDDRIRSMIWNNVTMRGVPGQEKFAILLDGSRISSPTNEPLPVIENYPVNLADHIEIMYGPASALYGADAMSGVINIITKKELNKDIEIEAYTSAGNDGLTNNTLLIRKNLGNNVNLIFSGQYMNDHQPDLSSLNSGDTLWNFDSHETGVFHTIYGDMKPQKSVKNKFEMPLSAYNVYAGIASKNFDISVFTNRTHASSAIENNPNNAVYNNDVFIEQGVTSAQTNYHIVGEKLHSTTSLQESFYEMDPTSNFRNLYTNMESGYKYAYGNMSRFEEQVDWKISDKFNLTGGGSYNHYISSPKSEDLQSPLDEGNALSGTMLGTQYNYRPEGLPAMLYTLKYYNAAGYLQTEFIPVSKISVTAGIRYDYNSRYKESINPRVGIVYHPFESSTIKMLYGSAFYAPSPFDAYEIYGSFYSQDSGRTYKSYYWHLPNPKLQPITMQNYELRFEQIVNKQMILCAEGYYSFVQHLYKNAPDAETGNIYGGQFLGYPVDYIETRINQDRQMNYGGSVSAAYRNYIDNVQLNIYASLSYVDGKIESGLSQHEEKTLDAEIEFISHFMFKSGIELQNDKWSVSVRMQLLSDQNITGYADTVKNVINRQQIPGYLLANACLRYNVGKHVTIQTGVTNLLNQKYQVSGWLMDKKQSPTELFYGADQDPIRVSVGLSVHF